MGFSNLHQPAGEWTWFLTWVAVDSEVSHADAGWLVSETESRGSRLKGPRCPRAVIGLLVGRTGIQGISGLVPAPWWAEPGSMASGCRALGRGSQSWCWPISGWDWTLELLAEVPKMSQSWYWPAGG